MRELSDIECVDSLILESGTDVDKAAWGRIKNKLKELAQRSHNTGSPKLPPIQKFIDQAVGVYAMNEDDAVALYQWQLQASA